jgi:hypothetical protein
METAMLATEAQPDENMVVDGEDGNSLSLGQTITDASKGFADEQILAELGGL